VADPPGVKTDPTLGKPTDTASPLMPWDPRACLPNQPIVNR
jgi:hypothetical protein